MLDQKWIDRLTIIRERVRNLSFIVLIWGPGETAGTLQQRKRQTLREDLTKLVGEGRVIFSEDLDPFLQGLREEGEEAAEYMEALAADAVVLIAESIGAVTEAALFREEIVAKTIAFTTRRDEPGFARMAYERLKVEEVEPEEWAKCDRVRRKAREFVSSVRIQRYREAKRRQDWE